MNPDGNKWSTSEGITRALTRVLFDSVNDATTECLTQMERERAAAARIRRPIRRRTFVPREHGVAHQRLFADYFAEQPRWGPRVFHRRFRMRRDLFLRIVRTLEERDGYFQYWEDAIDRPGLTPLQKCTVVIRQLANGPTTDMGVVEAFGVTYLRRPTAEDCQSLMRMHEAVHGFPGMLGSIDSGDMRVLFAAKQEGARKDVELAFGVLQSRWAIVKGPTRLWFKEVTADVMYACIILHNMIVEQKVGHVTDWVDDEGGSSSSTAIPPVARGLPMGFSEVLE
ncbi:uncharacterized protein LOC125190032 [Salvia hispanica]|uniref:uncharacterized protein LOC125190032 n=1 Tax=Salvia hispanica TaxID=49212 RepID=UPI0020092174|nr:uncharacterized protein LOC125190032 [Salvia hispanica]